MANVTVSNRTTDTLYDIGAIVCRTPKTLNDTVENDIPLDNRCVLITSTSQLVDYFGDPFIDPKEYTDLIIAYRLVSSGYPIYISSLYEMKDNDDGFNIKYNGYTEFYFKDKNGHKTVGYKLKSDLKFCQPIIQSYYSSATNELTLHISLYLMERGIYHTASELDYLNNRRLYKTYSIKFDTVGLKDEDIVNAYSRLGIELKLLNCFDEDSLVKEFENFTSFRITLNDNDSHSYIVDFHSDDYNYDFNDDNKIHNAYYDAIDRLASVRIAPSLLCIGKLYKSNSIISDGRTLCAFMEDLGTYNYSVIYNHLLQLFDEDSDTYLFINAPDVSVSTAVDFFAFRNNFKDMLPIPSQYNCDAFYGYAGDFIKNSLYYSTQSRVFFPVSVLAFYNTILQQRSFLPNAVSNLNITYDSVKSIISQDTADALMSSRCNSLVTFDKGYPSLYGDRSLSTSSNLRYSHISHNFVYIRRLIRAKIETIKFSLNIDYNLQLAANYISTDILQSFRDSGVLASFSVSYEVISVKSVEFNINLQFNGVIESINLNFTI